MICLQLFILGCNKKKKKKKIIKNHININRKNQIYIFSMISYVFLFMYLCLIMYLILKYFLL